MTTSTFPPSSISPTSPLICWLYGEDDAPLSLVGGKGANLARLVRTGFPAPDGFVITTAAYQTFLQNTGIGRADPDPAHLRTQITATPIPADLSAAIVAAYDQLGAPVVAVRSSGTAEDLASA